MANDVAIRVEGLSKSYIIGHQSSARAGQESFREMLGRSARNFGRGVVQMARGRQIVQGDEMEEFWALNDVSFEVPRGEVLGVIGRNGAGKSTLLKVLSRITEPTRGRVVISGRVASLLEVGTGFHPELTGRENIYLNGAILGMSQREIRAKFDEIVSFAGVEKFLDTPVKRYSSGMYVRLAFAVAAHMEPEILVVDEVLAVGDAEFQKKCLGKMSEVAGGGRTVLFVSHNMPSVQQLCTSGLMLDSGVVAYRGPIDTTISTYMNSLERISRQELGAREDRQGNGMLKVIDISLHDRSGERVEVGICGEPLSVRIHYEAQFDGVERSADIAFNLRNQAGIPLTCFGNIQTGVERMVIHRRGYFECLVPRVTVRGGRYNCTVFVGVDGETCDWIQNAFNLDVEDGDFFGSGNLVARDQGDLICEQHWSAARE